MSRTLILNFHGLGEPHAGVGAAEAPYWLGVDHFRTVLDDVVAHKERSDFSVEITFDDGNQSDLGLAVPELTARGLTATFFVCAGRIGAPRYLNAGDMAEMLGAGMRIGSHGMHHVDWRATDEATLDAEIGVARDILAQACGRSIDEAAIPFGSYDRRVLACLRRARWRAVYSSDAGFSAAGAWLRPRQTLDRSWEGDAAIARVLAGETPARQVRRRAARLYRRLR